MRDSCSLGRQWASYSTSTWSFLKQNKGVSSSSSSKWLVTGAAAAAAALMFGGFASSLSFSATPAPPHQDQSRLSVSETRENNPSSVLVSLSRSFLTAVTTTALCKGTHTNESAVKKEQSFIMVKPDGFTRGLCGDIIQRFEKKGYKLVAAKVLVPSEEIAKAHYAEHDGKPFFPKLVTFLTSGPVLALVFEGRGVIGYGRTMIGATNPLGSAPGTIRGDYGIDVGRNVIHGSDSPESAQREIALWFASGDVAQYDRDAIDRWVYE